MLLSFDASKAKRWKLSCCLVDYIAFDCMNSSRDICSAFSIICSSLSCFEAEIIKKNEHYIYEKKKKKRRKKGKGTYNSNHPDTKIRGANDKIPTSAPLSVNFLCWMTMGRANPGSTVSAFCSDSMCPVDFGSLHSCCSDSLRNWLPLH